MFGAEGPFHRLDPGALPGPESSNLRDDGAEQDYAPSCMGSCFQWYGGVPGVGEDEDDGDDGAGGVYERQAHGKPRHLPSREEAELKRRSVGQRTGPELVKSPWKPLSGQEAGLSIMHIHQVGIIT